MKWQPISAALIPVCISIEQDETTHVSETRRVRLEGYSIHRSCKNVVTSGFPVCLCSLCLGKRAQASSAVESGLAHSRGKRRLEWLFGFLI